MMADGRSSLALLALLATCNAKESAEESGGASTTLEPTPECVWDQPADECRAKPDICVFTDGGEVAWVDGACTVVAGDVGWCETTPSGGSDAPSGWHEVATGRVFVFSTIPFSPPEGWELCTCGPASPQACACVPNCDPGGDSSGE